MRECQNGKLLAAAFDSSVQYTFCLQPPAKKRISIDKEESRTIEIEIFDKNNQEKFDKLSSEKKIKSPFKRRLENEVADKPKSRDDKKSKQRKSSDEDSADEESDKKRSRKRFCTERVSESSSNCSSVPNKEFETDPQTLERRQKQIDYGKNTIGYDNYIKQVPKQERTRDHPKTPPKHLKYSRRAWEGLIKSWRKKLHTFDPSNNDDEEEEAEDVQE